MVRIERLLRIARVSILLARMTLPVLWNVVLFALRLVTLAVISLWVGVPQSVENIANEWLDRAVIAGFPTQWDRQLYYILWSLGLVTVVTGWVIFSFITVWIVKLIF